MQISANNVATKFILDFKPQFFERHLKHPAAMVIELLSSTDNVTI
jgi:hypothetical protein